MINLDRAEIFDVTVPFSDGMPVWPGDPCIELRPLDRISAGASSNVTQIIAPSHCGTHVDPPWHFIENGKRLHDIPITRWIGNCQVVAIPDHVSRIEPAHLEAAMVLLQTRRLLLKTSNSQKWGHQPLSFETDYVALLPEAANWVVNRGIELIGIDYLSIELYDGDGAVHRTLLENDVLVIEGLDLSAVKPGEFTLMCLPLPIVDGDGAPARVILIRDPPAESSRLDAP